MIENLKNYRNFVLNSKFKIILNFYYFIFQLRKEKQIIYISISMKITLRYIVSMFLRNVFTAIQNDLDEQRQDTRQNSLAVDFRYMKNANLFIVAQYICSTHSYER